jgi:hypothetical protein
MTRQLETQRSLCEKAEKALNELTLRYSSERLAHSRTCAELQHSLEAALSASSHMQLRMAAREEETKSEQARQLQRVKDLEDQLSALSQSLSTVRYKLSSSEGQVEALTKQAQSYAAVITRLEETADAMEMTHKREAERHVARAAELQEALDAAQKQAIEWRQKLADAELSRCGAGVEHQLSLQDALARHTIASRELQHEQERSKQLLEEVRGSVCCCIFIDD